MSGFHCGHGLPLRTEPPGIGALARLGRHWRYRDEQRGEHDGWWELCDRPEATRVVSTPDPAQRPDGEPCGGSCSCEPLHQRVREMNTALETLRTHYWSLYRDLNLVAATCHEFLDAIDNGMYRTADPHLRADFRYLRDVARRTTSPAAEVAENRKG